MKTVEAILEIIRASRGIDFSAYRPATAARRIRYRIRERDLPDAEYVRSLKEDEQEINRLISILTIKESSFFRNPPVYQLVLDTVIPDLASRKNMIYLWSAGCAMGEEPYSMGILIAEFRERQSTGLRCFIYASDVDANIIELARRAVYSKEAVRNAPKEYVRKYFTKTPCVSAHRLRDYEYELAPAVKADIFFDTIDLSGDLGQVPFSGFDIILCRNLLIYYTIDIQKKIIMNLMDRISQGGYLVLGEYETIQQDLRDSFEEISPQVKIFRKIK